MRWFGGKIRYFSVSSPNSQNWTKFGFFLSEPRCPSFLLCDKVFKQDARQITSALRGRSLADPEEGDLWGRCAERESANDASQKWLLQIRAILDERPPKQARVKFSRRSAL
jgi:hypothetical protein